MSADRESHDMNGMTDMTQTDIAFLLADAADEVEIGIAPVQAVIRGGRRRRARRWAVAAATTLVLTGSTGATLAVTGLPGGGSGDRTAPVAIRPALPRARQVDEPQRTDLASGLYRGKQWRVELQVWDAPRDRTEAVRQYNAMKRLGLEAAQVHRAADLIGKSSFFVTRAWGEHPQQQVMFNTAETLDRPSGTDLESIATRLGWGPESSGRLVIGEVAQTAGQVKCTWNDGTSTVAVPRAGVGASSAWFVCVAPEGRHYRSAEVMR
ncbi:hypothetical protein SRB17_08360 [Streptomyces sp. RB17]|uniref:hypothetical protein n=1 Tax=Streptomyces sp. RB17 TaxID=2585197 RepID=UPI001294AC25|nr:hypothetical protein [Streptomyces sp. RB17]MQY32877.1 hypothetical protein [Streptomyces sp. RB17]